MAAPVDGVLWGRKVAATYDPISAFATKTRHFGNMRRVLLTAGELQLKATAEHDTSGTAPRLRDPEAGICCDRGSV